MGYGTGLAMQTLARTVRHELVQALGDLAGHHIRPSLLVAGAGQQGQEHALRHGGQRLQGRVAQLAMHHLCGGCRGAQAVARHDRQAAHTG
jgi:hypothetical protein